MECFIKEWLILHGVVLYDYDSECPSGEFTAYRDHHCSTLGAPNGSANVNKCYESEVELHRR